MRKQQKNAESALAFRFMEGSLVQALRNGDWVLLDEINLATPETLECLCGLLESSSGSLVLVERGYERERFKIFFSEPVFFHGNLLSLHTCLPVLPLWLRPSKVTNSLPARPLSISQILFLSFVSLRKRLFFKSASVFTRYLPPRLLLEFSLQTKDLSQ